MSNTKPTAQELRDRMKEAERAYEHAQSAATVAWAKYVIARDEYESAENAE